MQLIAHTFVRTGELRGAEWSELNLGDAIWKMPAERMKAGEPHVVPLSTQTLALLQKPLTGRSRLVSPSERSPIKPMSENTILYALYRLGYHGRATGHGFRATASTMLNEMGYRPDVIERQLAHQERDKVRAADHRAEYLADRKIMMQAWADYVDQLARGPQAAGKQPSSLESAPLMDGATARFRENRCHTVTINLRD